MENAGLRRYAKERGVYLWQIADDLGISEPTMTRALRKKLPCDAEDRIRRAINRIATEKTGDVE